MKGKAPLALGAALGGLALLAAGAAVGGPGGRRPVAPPRTPLAPPRTIERVAPEPAEPRAPSESGPVAAPDRVRHLNELQETLARQLGDGSTTALQVVERMRAERDPAVLEACVGALLENPEAAHAPETVRALRLMAGADSTLERRRAALQFLGSAWDRDGEVRATILRLAREEQDPLVRHTALAALRDYGLKNHQAAAAVNAELLAMARGADGGEFRAQAVRSLTLHEADETALCGVADLLRDRSSDVRLSAAGALAEAPPGHRALVVAQIDGALAREDEAGVRHALLLSLVQAGRADALPVLDRVVGRDAILRQDARDYADILRRGETDIARIMDEKQGRDARRARPENGESPD